MNHMLRVLAGTSLLTVQAGTLHGFQATPTPPTPLEGLSYDADFFPGATHDPAVPTPDSVIGFRLGDKAVMHAQVEAVIKALAEKSPRCRLFEHGKTHEGRTLYHLAISSEENIRNLESIRASSAKLADPRTISAAEADSLAGTMPAIAWMAYAIHGDEMSGTDASLALAWHLASSQDESVKTLLRNVVVLIDPLMNPDGRDRCITLIRQNRTNAPSVDDQSIIHAEAWPSGRMNHYLFDMNRDWIFATQPETRGRIAAVTRWNPHYFMESHEQGSQDTFLFMPPREPVNPNLSKHVRDWETRFAEDLGKAFDAKGWRYYNGEWNEGWYPGYSGSWAAMHGMIDNLYEQANLQTDGVRRLEGTIETYREAVHKQLTSSITNLQTLSDHRAEVLRGYLADRRASVSKDAPSASTLYAIEPPPGNTARVLSLVDMLKLQGIEVFQAGAEFKASGKDWLGRDINAQSFTQGTLLIPAAQPLSHLVRALFELDPRMTPEFLTDERRELLRLGQSKLYDITGWNVAMLAGMHIWELDSALPAGAKLADLSDFRAPPPALEDSPIGWYADGGDDRSLTLAAHLMERGVAVRVLDKQTVLNYGVVARGSVFVFRKDNQSYKGDLKAILKEEEGKLGTFLRNITTGMGPGDNPDLGGQHLVLLQLPRIAVMTRDPLNPYTTGEIWHLLDQELGIRASFINSEMAAGVDLRRYNVVVIPDGGAEVAGKMMENLKAWTEAGGTLISIGSSCSAFAKEKDGLGSTRLLQDVLTKRDDYRVAVIRDWLGKNWTPDVNAVWSHTAADKVEYPWAIDGDSPSEEEAKRRDAWRSIFMPQGVILAARTDDRSWLTSGAEEILPVIYGGNTVLIPQSGMQAPVLFGALVPAPKQEVPAGTSPDSAKPGSSASSSKPTEAPAAGEKTKPEGAKSEAAKSEVAKSEVAKSDSKQDKDDAKKSEPKPGWVVAPPGYELRLRMSGLLWPEAADRLAHSAYVTRESIGAGQLIMFANSPTFRSATQGTKRIFANAVICGPGMGASQPIKP